MLKSILKIAVSGVALIQTVFAVKVENITIKSVPMDSRQMALVPDVTLRVEDGVGQPDHGKFTRTGGVLTVQDNNCFLTLTTLTRLIQNEGLSRGASATDAIPYWAALKTPLQALLHEINKRGLQQKDMQFIEKICYFSFDAHKLYSLAKSTDSLTYQAFLSTFGHFVQTYYAEFPYEITAIDDKYKTKGKSRTPAEYQAWKHHMEAVTDMVHELPFDAEKGVYFESKPTIVTIFSLGLDDFPFTTFDKVPFAAGPTAPVDYSGSLGDILAKLSSEIQTSTSGEIAEAGGLGSVPDVHSGKTKIGAHNLSGVLFFKLAPKASVVKIASIESLTPDSPKARGGKFINEITLSYENPEKGFIENATVKDDDGLLSLSFLVRVLQNQGLIQATSLEGEAKADFFKNGLIDNWSDVQQATLKYLSKLADVEKYSSIPKKIFAFERKKLMNSIAAQSTSTYADYMNRVGQFIHDYESKCFYVINAEKPEVMSGDDEMMMAFGFPANNNTTLFGLGLGDYSFADFTPETLLDYSRDGWTPNSVVMSDGVDAKYLISILSRPSTSSSAPLAADVPSAGEG